MERPGEGTSSGERAGLAGVGIAAFAVVCCASLPLLAGVAAGGIAVGAVLGIGAGVAVTVAVVAAIVVRVRRRREQSDATRRPERAG